MGFKTESDRLRKFEVKHFGISHTSDKPLPNHIEAQVFNPGKGVAERKYIEKYPAVEGRVINAEWYQREDKNGGQMYRGYELTMDIDTEVIILDVPFKQPPAPIYSLLVKHGENVDWSKPLEISAWETVNKKGQPKTGVCFWQVDAEGKRVSIKSAHTVENPNGCPAPEQDEITGKFDWRKVEKWLKFNFDDRVIPKIKAAAADYVPSPKPVATANGSVIIAEYDDSDDAYEVPEFAGEPPRARAASIGGKAAPDDPYGDDLGF
jgi:hypothetical protein